MSMEKINLIAAAIFVSVVLLSLPVSAGTILTGDPGYSGIASYGNGFHFTPFTPASALSGSYLFSGNAMTAYATDAAAGRPA